MANWKHTLDVKDAWQQTKAGEMTIQAFAATAAEKIKALPVEDNTLYDIADELETIAEAAAPDVDGFDRVWSRLYNWADQVIGGWNDKMCWIRTF
jgi:hypothetical protein